MGYVFPINYRYVYNTSMKKINLKSFLFISTLLLLTSCVPDSNGSYNDPYYDSGYNNREPYYGNYGNSRRERDRVRNEREDLQAERDRLEREKERIRREDDDNYQYQGKRGGAEARPQRESCPSGYSPSEQKCSSEERRRGCKDMRLPGGLGCVNR